MCFSENIGLFKNLENVNGQISLSIGFGFSYTNIIKYNFHINELRDFMYSMNTNVDKDDTLVEIKLDKHYTEGLLVNVPCIIMKTQDNYTEFIFQDDSFFFEDFLKIKFDETND